MQEQEEAKLCVFPQTTYRRVTIRPAFPLVGCEVIFDQVTKRSVQVKPWRAEKKKIKHMLINDQKHYQILERRRVNKETKTNSYVDAG